MGTSNEALWALAGVVIGGLLSGLLNYLLQKAQFKHNREMFALQNQSKENVKEILEEMLLNKRWKTRTFEVMRKRIGGYTDEELRTILHELGARKTENADGKEAWYLKEEEESKRKSVMK